MAKNLVIVESPAKAKTIEGYLGKDFVVKSSFGHVRDLSERGLSINIENNFEPIYEISEDKKKVVAELKKLAKEAEIVWLASDEDREGEAISWHLFQALNLDKSKTKRIVFNEITKKAITKAIEKPRDIDYNLVNAQQARRILDRLVGYELSPVLWKKVKPSLSAGRVQSVAVRLIVERERERQNFSVTSFYRINSLFVPHKSELKSFKAELNHKFDTGNQAEDFLKKCSEFEFSIENVETKPASKSPSAPFTTSTLQQEASRKLGYSVARTMQLAQKLYESGKITYMRTDSVNLSDYALEAAENAIHQLFGKPYHNRRQFTTKSKGAQEAHECIRPTDMTVQVAGNDASEERLYELIWKRTIASQMSDARLEKTNIYVHAPDSYKFIARGEVIKFDGFLKVYMESSDEEDEEKNDQILPDIKAGDRVNYKEIIATERFTIPPARYTEASLVKKLEELGIGRPSTYAPTISTIQKRGYVVKEEKPGTERRYNVYTLKDNQVTTKHNTEITGAEKNKLSPTDIGMVVNDFLVENFKKIMDYNFTASVEKEFDEIAEGEVEWEKMIRRFYDPFHENVELTEKEAGKVTGKRMLGVDPDSGKNVYVLIGRYGPMAQIGEVEDEEKPKFASLQKNQSIETITLSEVLDLFKLPKSLGSFQNNEVIVGIGRFGPYVKYLDSFISLAKGEDPMSVDLDRAIQLIKSKNEADAPIAFYEEEPVQKGTGRFGPFIKWKGMFINVSRKYDFNNLSQSDIEELIESKKQKDIDKVIHNWVDEGIKVEKARWGRAVILKGKLKIELPKTVNAEKLTLDEVKTLIAEKSPAQKKKTASPKSKKKASLTAKKSSKKK